MKNELFICSVNEQGIMTGRTLNCVAWESTLTGRIFSTEKEAEKDAEVYCMLHEIKFNPYKHIKLVFLWIK